MSCLSSIWQLYHIHRLLEYSDDISPCVLNHGWKRMALVSVVVTDEICLRLWVDGFDGVYDEWLYARTRQTFVNIWIISSWRHLASSSWHRACTNHDPLLGFWNDTYPATASNNSMQDSHRHCKLACSAVSGALLVPWTPTSTSQCRFAVYVCVWPQNVEPTTNRTLITRAVSIQASAQYPRPTCSSTKLVLVAAAVSYTVV